MADNHIEIEVEIRAETPKALLVYNGRREAWIPKSLISDQCENEMGTITSIFLSEYIANEKGLL